MKISGAQFLAIFAIAVLAGAISVPAIAATAAPISGTLGGGGVSGFVKNFYTFALGIAGLLAFGAIVYGAIKYTVSAGNPSQQSDAKEWITQALWGLLLLVGATLILSTLNPKVFDPGNGGFVFKLCDPGKTDPHLKCVQNCVFPLPQGATTVCSSINGCGQDDTQCTAGAVIR